MQEIAVKDYQDNPFTLFPHPAVAVMRAEGKTNALTLSWGALGIIYEKKCLFIFVRDSRYSRPLLDKASTFSVCFLPAKDKKAIAYLGSHSGRDEDKIQGSHLDLAEEDGTPYFKDSELVLVAKKLVRAPLAREKITDPAIVQAFYPQDGFHYVYVGEIVKVLKR